MSKRDLTILEVYPSLAEGIGLENRQAGNTARGFESLYLLHFYFYVCSGIEKLENFRMKLKPN